MKLTLLLTLTALIGAVCAIPNIAPQPFTIKIPAKDINDFKNLLKYSRIAAPTRENLQENGTFANSFGVDNKWLTSTKLYWEKTFDWRKVEKKLNTFQHFKSNVTVDRRSQSVHFVGLFSKDDSAILIALFHGWTDKYTPETLPYNVIVPSLPGFTFSSSVPLDTDFTMVDVAKFMNQLMVDLGYGSGYFVQGGDIGSGVATVMARLFSAVRGYHLNLIVARSPQLANATLTAAERAGVEREDEFLATGFSYFTEHVFKPSTIGLAIDSNPLALLAWMGEKFLAWVDALLPLDTILESIAALTTAPASPNSKAPLGYSKFPKDIRPTPRIWAATTGNMTFYSEHDVGGHFAALEQPTLLLADIEAFVQQVSSQ